MLLYDPDLFFRHVKILLTTAPTPLCRYNFPFKTHKGVSSINISFPFFKKKDGTDPMNDNLDNNERIENIDNNRKNDNLNSNKKNDNLNSNKKNDTYNNFSKCIDQENVRIRLWLRKNEQETLWRSYILRSMLGPPLGSNSANPQKSQHRTHLNCFIFSSPYWDSLLVQFHRTRKNPSTAHT